MGSPTFTPKTDYCCCIRLNATMPATTAETLSIVNRTVSVAPLVLLSAADHYGRSAKGTRKRVVGVLLGQNEGSIVRVSNSFAVPFEEDDKDPSVWFLDHNYIEGMNDMFKKYTPNPLLVIVDVQPKDVGVPTDAYFAVEEIKDDGTSTSKTFVHTPTTIEAEESEEIGVEHLLRDIRDVAAGTLSTRITSQLQSLQGLHLRLQDIGKYLQKVVDGDLPVNHTILGNLQDVFNLLPNLSAPKAVSKDLPSVNGMVNGSVGISGGLSENTELAKAMSVKTNDQLMSIYLSSLIRAITAFHDLIENKIQNKRQQEDDDARKEEADKKHEIEREEKLMLNGTLEKTEKESKEGEPKNDEKNNKKR